MDPKTLVIQQVEAGRHLLNILIERGYPIQSAGWIRKVGADQWYLYIGTNARQTLGSDAEFQIVSDAARSMKSIWFDPLDVWILRAEDPLSQGMHNVVDVLKVQDFLPYKSSRVGDVPVEGAVIYAVIRPAVPAAVA